MTIHCHCRTQLLPGSFEPPGSFQKDETVSNTFWTILSTFDSKALLRRMLASSVFCGTIPRIIISGKGVSRLACCRSSRNPL